MRRLVIYFAGVGDLIMFIPLFRKLAEEGELDLLTRAYGTALLRGQSFVTRTYTLAHPNRGRERLSAMVLGRHRLKLGRELGLREYDEVIVLAQEREVITSWVKGWIGDGKLRTMEYPEQNPDRLSLAFTSLGLSLSMAAEYPVLDVGEEDRMRLRAELARLGRRVISVQAGAGHLHSWRGKRPDLRRLTPQQWAEFLSRILASDDAYVIAFHGRADQGVAVQEIVRRLPSDQQGRAHDLTGCVDLHRLKAFLAESCALLSMNSGPAHMAAAVGCPLLVFYGPANPAAYCMEGRAAVERVVGSAPCQFCMGTPQYKTCRDSVCLNTIGVDEMFRAWQRLGV